MKNPSGRPKLSPLRSPARKLGIVGGGQLARMLALEAIPYGLEVHVLCEKAKEPAAQVTQFWQQGDPSNEMDQLSFARKVDLITFESEFYKMDSFLQIQESEGTFVFPKPEVMSLLQNRNTQKELLLVHHLATADFMSVENLSDLEVATKKWNHKFVLKKTTGGYDGYGTFFCRGSKDLEKLIPLFPGQFIAEEIVPFKRELAVIAVRSADGSFFSYPLVETRQVAGRCDWVCGPVTHRHFAQLEKKLGKFLSAIDYVGAMGIEFFDTGAELCINEIAPRVHNSGHYTQEAFAVSQFLAHIQAGLGEKLNKPKALNKAFCMINLIGGAEENVLFPSQLGGKLHWYGKLENRPGRKMGHLNYSGKTTKEILKLGLAERKKFHL